MDKEKQQEEEWGRRHAPCRAYICLGSNLGHAEATLEAARAALARLPDMRLEACSPVYHTQPQEDSHQPWFLNQVAALIPGSSWRPCSLVDALLALEASLGRVRSPESARRYGPRTLDADLLLFGEEVSTDPHCLVPHPRLTVRAFALIPLLDVAPHIAIDGRPARWWLQRLTFRKVGDRIFQ